MNAEGLRGLARNASAWSAAYVALKEAMIKEGVDPAEAAQQAACAASMAAHTDAEWDGDVCPLCGGHT